MKTSAFLIFVVLFSLLGSDTYAFTTGKRSPGNENDHIDSLDIFNAGLSAPATVNAFHKHDQRLNTEVS